MTRRALLLALIPAALMAQTPLVWRSNDGKAYTQGLDGQLVPYELPTARIASGWEINGVHTLRVVRNKRQEFWRRNSDEAVWVVDRRRKPEYWTYGAYFVAVTGDYLSTRYALRNGAAEAVYKCNPHRPGCMNQAAFWTVAAVPVAMWVLHDLWLGKHTSDRWRRIESVFRKVVIGGRAGVAAYNGGVAQGIAGSR